MSNDTTRTAHDRLHDALYSALRELETRDLPDDARTNELAKRAGSLLSDLDQVLEQESKHPFNGDHMVPDELRPALDLYARLVQRGENLPTAKVIAYLRECGRSVAVNEDDDYLVTEPDLTRRGLAFVYAAAHMHYLLCGTETVEEATR